MSTFDTDVLVVGAGPSGLTLACELRRRGIDCRVIEKAPEFHHRSRGKGLQPRSLEVFDDLGIAEAALTAGRTHHRLDRFRQRSDRGLTPAWPPPAHTRRPQQAGVKWTRATCG